MNSWVQRAYHSLPAPLRDAAAGAWGHYLRRIRYGPDYDALVAAATARETWTADEWQRYQGEQLASLLHRAATRVPYYREQWAARRARGDAAAWDRLENWPVLEKAAVRANPTAFVADDCDRRSCYREHTSGTSGSPLSLWWSRSTVRAWYGMWDARVRHWYGVTRHDRWAILGGQLVTPVTTERPPFWVWNGALNQLYLSAYHLRPDFIPHYVEALKRHEVRYILGYPSALATLAHEMVRSGRRLDLAVAIGNAEPLYGWQREVIATAFGCPVRETYGLAELAAAASECAEGSLHLWPDVGVVELASHDAEGPAAMICTGLLNVDMPLIRYAVGDAATPAAVAAPCRCGRTLPLLDSIAGRTDDVLLTRDGRTVGRLDPVFKHDLPIREAQIVQETLTRIRVRLVPDGTFDAAAARIVKHELRTRLGDVDVEFEPVNHIPRGPNGKFRAVVSQVHVGGARPA